VKKYDAAEEFPEYNTEATDEPEQYEVWQEVYNHTPALA
jgi:hypothetical protein